jgi:hypothetical protein
MVRFPLCVSIPLLRWEMPVSQIGLCIVLWTSILFWGSHVRVVEEKTLAPLTALEEKHQSQELASLSNFKGSRKLRNLECSINCNARGESSSRGKGKACVF